VVIAEQRPEDQRAERRAEHRSEEDERDATGAPLHRIHVGGGSPREDHRARGGADEGEAENDEWGRDP
jgi:hypothetical protein